MTFLGVNVEIITKVKAMKNTYEKVRLSTEELTMVAGGAGFTTLNISAVKQPGLQVYAQVAPSSLGALVPVSTFTPTVSALQPVATRF
jgi:hypothetical protein